MGFSYLCEIRAVLVHLNGASLDVCNVFLAVCCVFCSVCAFSHQGWKERVVMGDLYRHHQVMRAGLNVFSILVVLVFFLLQ